MISVFGKGNGVSGGVEVSVNRPGTNQWKGSFPEIAITDTTWTYYSYTGTITSARGDSIFIAVLTGACELCFGTTYLNTFQFEKLD
jgi:hypothetical protein